MSLIAFWVISFLLLTTAWRRSSRPMQSEPEELLPPHHEHLPPLVIPKEDGTLKTSKQIENSEKSLEPHNLSRSGNVTATSDVRGNLGPAGVVVQIHPGKDWLHDRWQAASDMHGTNIPGEHWIQLDFKTEIVPEKIVLDWEAAYSDLYRIEASLQPFPLSSSSSLGRENNNTFWILFDGTDKVMETRSRSVRKSGQSPGVNTKTPLHIIHTLHPLENRKPLRYIRLYILKPAKGWGVSLWQFDVYGFYKEQVVK